MRNGVEYSYTLNSQGVLVSVSPNWDDFALANDGVEACAGRVIGLPWTTFVTGKEVRVLYRTLMKRAYQSEKPVRVPFRCDGPTVRRGMEMILRGHLDRSVSVRCRIVREERRDSIYLLTRNAKPNAPSLLVCSWCANVKLEERWIEIEQAVRTMRLFDPLPVPPLTHGLCDACMALYGLTPDDLEHETSGTTH